MFKRSIVTVFIILIISCASFCEGKKLASAYISEGIANYEQGNYIEAILNLRSAEQLSPNPVNVYKYLGMAYSKLSLWTQAVREFNKIIYIDPADADREDIIKKINEWESQKATQTAMAQYSFYSIKYKNRIWEQPDNLLNYIALTEIYKCSGRYVEAENFFRALMKDSPSKIIFKKYLADVLFLNRRYAEAGGLYRRILDEEPLNMDAILGINYIFKQRYDEMIQKQPGNISHYLKVARVLRDLKRYEDAISYYNRYLEKDSANADVRRELDETNKIFSVIVPKR